MDGLGPMGYWEVFWAVGLFLVVPVGLLIVAYVALVRAWEKRRAFQPPDRSQRWRGPDESRAPAMRRDNFYGAQTRPIDEEPQPTSSGVVGTDLPGRTARSSPGGMAGTGRQRWGRALIGGATTATGLATLSVLFGAGPAGGAAVVLVIATVVVVWVFTCG